MRKSMRDVAYELVLKKKKPLEFIKLWEEVSQLMGYNKEQARNNISFFYTQLTIDGRFVNLGDNVWDLRNRHTFDKVHIDMNDAYSDLNEEEAEVIDIDVEITSEDDDSGDDEEDKEKEEFDEFSEFPADNDDDDYEE